VGRLDAAIFGCRRVVAFLFTQRLELVECRLLAFGKVGNVSGRPLIGSSEFCLPRAAVSMLTYLVGLDALEITAVGMIHGDYMW
jgi:hypothetical protein